MTAPTKMNGMVDASRPLAQIPTVLIFGQRPSRTLSDRLKLHSRQAGIRRLIGNFFAVVYDSFVAVDRGWAVWPLGHCFGRLSSSQKVLHFPKTYRVIFDRMRLLDCAGPTDTSYRLSSLRLHLPHRREGSRSRTGAAALVRSARPREPPAALINGATPGGDRNLGRHALSPRRSAAGRRRGT
jgi:hypothetical protein